MERMQKQSKKKCYQYRQDRKQKKLRFVELIDCDFGLFSLEGVSAPGNQRKQRHGGCHAEIGEHFSIVSICKGNDTVKHTENQHEQLSGGVSLCAENERGYTDNGGAERQVVFTVKKEKCRQNQEERGAPEGAFSPGKIGIEMRFFCIWASSFPKKKDICAHLLRPNDVRQMPFIPARWQGFFSVVI